MVTLTSDNTSALAMTATLKVTASTLIAKELALLFSETSFQPRHVDHIPGMMHTYADVLSRLFRTRRQISHPRGAQEGEADAHTA